MSFEDEIASLETAIGNLVAATLTSIRKKLSGSNDFVLIDTDENFKVFFLETAKNKIDYAYNAYLMQAKVKNLILTSNNKSADETPEKLVTQTIEETKNSTAVHSSPDNRQRPNSLLSDITAMRKNRELQLQNELQNSLHIVGLPLRGGDQKTLLSLFKILCNHLLVPLDETDIENIRSGGRGVTVAFHEQYKKDQVLMQYRRMKYLKSDQLLRLLPGEVSTPVCVYPKETEFYRRLSASAQCYVNKKQIFCHRTTSQGLGIMLTAHSEFVYVQSQYELQEVVSRLELMKKKI